MRRPEITDYILFSPSPKMKDFSFIIPCSSNGLIIYEENVPNSAEEIIEKLSNKTDSHVETMPFDDINIEKSTNEQEKLVNNESDESAQVKEVTLKRFTREAADYYILDTINRPNEIIPAGFETVIQE